MTSWRVGRFTVHKVVEFVAPMPVNGVLATTEPDLLGAFTWPSPAYAGPDGTCVLSFHSLVVDTGDRVVVVDTCVGNDRVTIPQMPTLSTGWFETLEKIVPAADVDTVAVTAQTAERWNLTSIADLAAHSAEVKFGAPSEFLNRREGLPGLTAMLRGRGLLVLAERFDAQIALAGDALQALPASPGEDGAAAIARAIEALAVLQGLLAHDAAEHLKVRVGFGDNDGD